MFNAEKLLGKIIKETLGGRTKSSGLLDSLTSGAGLMTVVGLGVGAFEILSAQKAQKSNASHSTPVPPPIGSGSKPTAPPPLPKTMQAPPVPSEKSEKNTEGEKLALRLIQVMIAAAHADGILDESEEKAILDHLRGAELDSEEKMFLLDELHRPKSLAELTSGIDNPSTAKTMYMLAAATVEVDTETEREWLNELARQLGITPEVRNFIEEQCAMKN
jgi:uncharacterized membrane protein YebE (DUF533 family)